MFACDRDLAQVAAQRGWAIRLPIPGGAPAQLEDVRGLRLLAVHAHPDDETALTGGLLARAAAGGAETALITCTEDRGAVSTPFDPDWDPADRTRLAEIRTEELRTATTALGIEPNNVHLLRYRDSGMAGEPANLHPEAFGNADVAEVGERIAGIIAQLRPHVVVGYDDAGGYGHPDHLMAHRVTVRAVLAARRAAPSRAPWNVQKLYYTTFPRCAASRAIDAVEAAGGPSPLDGPHRQFFTAASPDGWATTAVDCRLVYDRKRAALSAHRSQIPPDWPMLALPSAVAAEVFGTEYFHCAYSLTCTVLPEASVFAGIRL